MDVLLKLLKLSLVSLFVSLVSKYLVEGRVLSLSEDLEIEAYLKKMNKPAVQTLKGPQGELIDCVDIYKQPALDHPLLKNHTIQLAPSFMTGHVDFSYEVLLGWSEIEKCPQGTIPIRRILKEDILRAPSFESFGKKYPSNYTAQDPRAHVHAVIVMNGGPYFGAKADINVWNPYVRSTDFSLAQLWVTHGPGYQNTVEAGIAVNPALNGDKLTRFFVFWTADGYQHGCYNLLCPGFVQTNHRFPLSASFQPSTLNGLQYQINLQIFKDVNQGGNWWVILNGVPIGYMPNSLLSALAGGADSLHYGGEVCNPNYRTRSTYTVMGSGKFAQEGHKRAAYFKNIQAAPADGKFYPVTTILPVGMERPECYNLLEYPGFFYYGGPGRSIRCR